MPNTIIIIKLFSTLLLAIKQFRQRISLSHILHSFIIKLLVSRWIEETQLLIIDNNSGLCGIFEIFINIRHLSFAICTRRCEYNSLIADTKEGRYLEPVWYLYFFRFKCILSGLTNYRVISLQRGNRVERTHLALRYLN